MFDLHTFTLPSLEVSNQDATVKAYTGQQSKGIFRCLISNGQRRVICEGPLPVINDNILIFFLEFNMRHESNVHAMPHCLFIIFIEDNLQKHFRAVCLTIYQMGIQLQADAGTVKSLIHNLINLFRTM